MPLQIKANWFLAAIFASLVLHIGSVAWWLSQPVQPLEQAGTQAVIVELIAQPVTESPAPSVLPPAQSEPEALPEDDMALQQKVLKKLPEKKPPEKKPVSHKPSPVPTKPAIAASQAPVTAASQASAPVVTTVARYDADYLNNPAPTYPPLSRRLGEEGRVILRVQVSAEGKPLRVELKQSSGFERLDQAAIKAAEAWRFVPARQAGIPVTSGVEVPLQFSLKK